MVGYNARCKLCNCEYRAQAEKMHEDGLSNQQIADFLSDHDVSISKASVRRHFDTHFAPKEEAAKRYYEESENIHKEAVERRLTDLEMLDATIQANFELHQGARKWLKEKVESVGVTMDSKPMVDLLNGTGSEIRQGLKLKAELLGDKEPDGKTTIVVGLPEGFEEDDDS